MSSGTRRGLRNLPNSNDESLTDIIARRPELRDVGIAGYLVGAAVDGAPGMPATYACDCGCALRVAGRLLEVAA